MSPQPFVPEIVNVLPTGDYGLETAMPLVKAAAVLHDDLRRHRLLPAAVRLRRGIECVWPKWRDGRWHLTFTPAGEVCAASLEIWPTAAAVLRLFDIDGEMRHKLSKPAEYTAEELNTAAAANGIEAAFTYVHYNWLHALAAHLAGAA